MSIEDETRRLSASIVLDADLRRDERYSRFALLCRDGRYRYVLGHVLSVPVASMPRSVLGVVMFNPSTADADKSDPTMRRLTALAQSAGATSVLVGNLYAVRSSEPREVFTSPNPVGAHNDEALRAIARASDRILCAWGGCGGLSSAERTRKVIALLSESGKPLVRLGATSMGEPRHPLFFKAPEGALRLEPLVWHQRDR